MYPSASRSRHSTCRVECSATTVSSHPALFRYSAKSVPHGGTRGKPTQEIHAKLLMVLHRMDWLSVTSSTKMHWPHLGKGFVSGCLAISVLNIAISSKFDATRQGDATGYGKQGRWLTVFARWCDDPCGQRDVKEWHHLLWSCDSRLPLNARMFGHDMSWTE